MEQVVVEPAGGERVSRKLNVLADTDQVVATEMFYAPGDSGPDAHVHHEHSDCFWIVGGRVVFEVGREAQRVEMPAGSFVGVPPEVVHTFRNEGPEDARIVNFHAPGCGFARYVRAMAAGEDADWFDSDEPPADGGPPASAALIVPPGEGERDDQHPGAAIVWKSCTDQLAAAEQEVEAGFAGPPPHRHDTFTDAFYVLEGAPRFALGGETVDAVPGTFVLAPPGAVHAFSNPDGGPARMLTAMTPGREARAALVGEYDFIRA